MFKPRKIVSDKNWRDKDGIKLYSISVDDAPVEPESYQERLEQVKVERNIIWRQTAAFAIFHHGESFQYLVLVWWGNDNELFTSVSVRQDDNWQEDASKFSFCLYDMEVMWRERNIYIETIDCAKPSLEAYRQAR